MPLSAMGFIPLWAGAVEDNAKTQNTIATEKVNMLFKMFPPLPFSNLRDANNPGFDQLQIGETTC